MIEFLSIITIVFSVLTWVAFIMPFVVLVFVPLIKGALENRKVYGKLILTSKDLDEVMKLVKYGKQGRKFH